MKTRFISFIIVGLLAAGVFVYLNNVQEKPSYVSPEEALKQEEDLPLKVTEMIATKYVEENTIAYIVFLSDDDIENYIAIAQLVKRENGWHYNKYLGLGHASENNIGNASAKEGFAGGFIAERCRKNISI
jgi:CCR4-NOT transcriptional regulation complex NOT5 subunit